ncbi:MAG: amidohydrolase family protein [Phycisphaerales bacterium]|nr:amidohydrolase family protein [Phycisphaerales bacterium]
MASPLPSASLPLCAMLAFASPALAQDLLPKAPPQSAPIMIYNATVHPVSGPPIADGFVMFSDGNINGVGTFGPQIDIDKNRQNGWTMIDATGKHIYPGLIAAYSQIGLTEFAAVRATLDTTEVGGVTPEVRAGVAVNPDSTLIPVARSNGILLAGVFPTSGALCPGRASIMRLDGWTTESMAADMEAGLTINWPNIRPFNAPWMNRSREEQRAETDTALAAVEKLFTDARAYRDARNADATLPTDLRLEAMKPLFAPAAPASEGAAPAGNGHAQKPVFILANDYDQIHSAVAFADRHKLRIVIVGGMDAHLAADLLKARDIPVIITGTHRFPKRADGDYDEPFSLPAKLHNAGGGVRFAISSGEEAANERNLPYAVGTAVAHGLDRDQAVRSMTLSAAEVLGVSDRFGSLEPGKSATLFITDGDILEITTAVERAWIDGRELNLANKQTELEKKYREKYRQLESPPSTPAPKP